MTLYSPGSPTRASSSRLSKSYVVLTTCCGALGLLTLILLAPLPWPLAPAEHPASQQEACQQQTTSGIPTIIHQSYKSQRLPPDFAEWQQSWLRLHPSWCYMFWTDKDNRYAWCTPSWVCTEFYAQEPCQAPLPLVFAAVRRAAQADHARRCRTLPLHAQVWRPVL